MSKRRCKAKTKKGKPCQAKPLSDTDFCMAHSGKEVQESVGFGGAQQGAGRPPTPRLMEVMRERVEAAADELLAPYFQAVGIVGWNDDGTPIVDESKAAMEVGRSNTGQVNITEIADLRGRITAAERLMDRTFGKPKQAMEHTGPDGGPISFADLAGAASE